MKKNVAMKQEQKPDFGAELKAAVGAGKLAEEHIVQMAAMIQKKMAAMKQEQKPDFGAELKAAAFVDLGRGKCLTSANEDPDYTYRHGMGKACEQLCSLASDCY